jgi:UV DNA damage repair endonuclease
MHPGPFCILASRNPAALANGIAELDYHAEVMAMMGVLDRDEVAGDLRDPVEVLPVRLDAGIAGADMDVDGVRLSMHPGPFCILASRNPAALANGIAELDYHAEVRSRP